jgi:hypothetical protein
MKIQLQEGRKEGNKNEKYEEGKNKIINKLINGELLIVVLFTETFESN